METHVIKIDCPDQKGLVHKVSGAMFTQGLNIEDQGEFVDTETKHFFMRTEVTGKVDTHRLHEDISKVVPDGARVRIKQRAKKKIVVLVTKEWHCLAELLVQHKYANLNGNVLAVVGNHRDLEELTEQFSVPFHYVPHKDKAREAHEREVEDVLGLYQADYLVLAKYMRIISPDFISRYPDRIVNIHHSFLPAFVGAKPYHRAFNRGVKIIGASAHFTSEDLDEGPIIYQDVIPVSHTKSIQQMIQEGRNVEKTVLVNALRLVFEDRVFVHKNRTIIFD
jgi:formyltetrahydrofolate deformylase